MGAQPRIESYEFGRVVIDDKVYTSDVIILPGEVKDDWRRREGHVLRPADLLEVLEKSPQVLIVGRGASSAMRVTDEALACLEEEGIEAVCLPTAEAVQVYNERVERGETVAAALHLTC